VTVHDPDAERMVDVNGTMTDLTGYDRNILHELGVEGVTASTRQDADGYGRKRFRLAADGARIELGDDGFDAAVSGLRIDQAAD
jgi:hypothetical protein